MTNPKSIVIPLPVSPETLTELACGREYAVSYGEAESIVPTGVKIPVVILDFKEEEKMGDLPKQFKVRCPYDNILGITKDKEYSVIDAQDCAILIKDDNGEEVWHGCYRFEYAGEVTP